MVHRGVAQSGLERLFWEQKVAGSNPATPIIKHCSLIINYTKVNVIRLHMKICNKCNLEFKTRVKIDGKWRSINNRKYCLQCSPFNTHNTKQLVKIDKPYKCACGETNPDMFYGNKHTVCSKCHCKYTLNKGKQTKAKSIEYKGGKCSICEYNRCNTALEFHHIDPSKKDLNFKGMRGWAWERVVNELDKCILVCSNCHREIHSGLTSMQENTILDV